MAINWPVVKLHVTPSGTPIEQRQDANTAFDQRCATAAVHELGGQLVTIRNTLDEVTVRGFKTIGVLCGSGRSAWPSASVKTRRPLPVTGSEQFGNRSAMDRIGATGFEPATSCSQSKRATKLRYAPIHPSQAPA